MGSVQIYALHNIGYGPYGGYTPLPPYYNSDFILPTWSGGSFYYLIQMGTDIMPTSAYSLPLCLCNAYFGRNMLLDT